MASESQLQNSPGLVPAAVIVLVAAHVVALVFWIYKLATEKAPARKKIQ